MKIRNGFVSNSSSSSFICEISGHIETDYDCLSDADMFSCENNHTFSREFLVGKLPEDYDDWDIPKENCPICTLNELGSDYIAAYLLKKYNLVEKDVITEIRTTFGDFSNFSKYIK